MSQGSSTSSSSSSKAVGRRVGYQCRNRGVEDGIEEE
jgi:hypothetical protein